MLTVLGQQKYALATGKHFIAVCDQKNCGKLIPVGALYTVLKWGPRKDGLTFLGLRVVKLRCMECQFKKYPLPVIVKKGKKVNKVLTTAIMKLYTKSPNTSLDTKTLISKFKLKTKFSKLKRSEFTKVLKALKKDKSLIYKEKVWKLSKQPSKIKGKKSKK